MPSTPALRHRMPPAAIGLLLCLALTLTFSLTLAGCAGTEASDPATRASTTSSPAGLAYPLAPRSEHRDRYHGVEVADPYRWLEDLSSPATHRFMRAQDDLTRSLLEGEASTAFAERIQDLWSLATFGLPVQAGGRLFYTRNDGGSQQTVLRVRRGEAGVPRTLVDPNREARLAGRRLVGFVPSRDGARVAFGHAEGGSQWATWEVLETATGRRLGEPLTGLVRTSIAWRPDGRGFFYTRQDQEAPDAEAARTALHGRESVHWRPVGDDPLAREFRVHPEDGGDRGEDLRYSLAIPDRGDRLVITERRPGDVRSRLWVADLPPEVPGKPSTQDAPTGLRPRLLVGDLQTTWNFVGDLGDELVCHTDQGAPAGRLVAVRPDGAIRDLVAEAEDAIIFAHQVAGHLLVVYSQDAVPRVQVHDEAGRFQRLVELPQLAYLGSFSGRRSDRRAYYRLSGLTDPGTVYHLDPASGESRVLLRGELPFRPEDYITEQHFTESADGTRVPFFVARRRDLPARGGHPTMLYGYGAWGWSALPWFQPEVLAWMEAGGAYALANVRGGGEYGETWHRAGIQRQKQNGIDDFLAVAEWLVDQGFTDRERLAARGGSASGPLAGAAAVQRPDLFGAALLNIPALDMLRFHTFTGGKRWEPEFGRPDDPDDFRALHAYSPYHNLEAGDCYPATLVTAGEEDEVTVPSHAYKYVAALQHAQQRTADCEAPVLLQIAWGSGHSLGADRDRSIESMARMLAFLDRNLGPKPSRHPPGEG